jgi:hypothetical protein
MLVVTGALLLPSCAMGIWAVFVVTNVKLAKRNPRRWSRFQEVEKSPWYLWTRWMEAEAEALRASGFTELGLSRESAATVHVFVRVFYNTERGAWATLWSVFFRPQVGFVSRLSNGSIAWTVRHTDWTDTEILRIQKASGTTAERFERHDAFVVALGGSAADSPGTLAAYLDTVRQSTRIHAEKAAEMTTYLPALESVPPGVMVREGLHCLEIHVPARAQRGWWAGVALLLPALWFLWQDMWLGFGILFLLIVADLFNHGLAKPLRLRVSGEAVEVLGSKARRISLDRLSLVVDGGVLVLCENTNADAESGRHEFPGYGSQAELDWLVDVVELARTDLFNQGPEVCSPPNELVDLMRRGLSSNNDGRRNEVE